MNTKTVLRLAAACSALGAFADPNDPQISLVLAKQDDNRVLKVVYTLDEPAIVTFDVKTNGVSIGAANLKLAYGDVHRVVDATDAGETRTLFWPAYEAWPDHKSVRDGAFSVTVTAWATNSPPDYMVIKLVGEDKGVRTFYTAPEQLPGVGGVTNDVYKTDYLVMRRIPAKDAIFPMGLHNTKSPSCLYHRVKLTNDFYMAVYELTLGQYKNVIGSDASVSWIEAKFPDAGYSSNMANPVAQTTRNDFRGSTKTWKNNGHDIDSGSKLQTFRTVLGIGTLDLPTDAEWEFACRVGTATDRYDGVNVTSGSSPLPTDIAWMNANSTTLSLYGGGEIWGLPNEVGKLQPNAFGLYDTLGNVGEMCLDLYNEDEAYAIRNDDINGEPTIAPQGPDADKNGTADGGADAMYVQRGKNVTAGIWGVVAYDRASVKAAVTYICAANGGPYGYRLVCLP